MKHGLAARRPPPAGYPTNRPLSVVCVDIRQHFWPWAPFPLPDIQQIGLPAWSAWISGSIFGRGRRFPCRISSKSAFQCGLCGYPVPFLSVGAGSPAGYPTNRPLSVVCVDIRYRFCSCVPFPLPDIQQNGLPVWSVRISGRAKKDLDIRANDCKFVLGQKPTTIIWQKSIAPCVRRPATLTQNITTQSVSGKSILLKM